MSVSLRVVAPTPDTPASLSERVRHLQAQARDLAREHVSLLEANLLAMQRIADEIAQGGEAYPPGVRDIARRLGEDGAAKARTLEAIMARR